MKVETILCFVCQEELHTETLVCNNINSQRTYKVIYLQITSGSSTQIACFHCHQSSTLVRCINEKEKKKKSNVNFYTSKYPKYLLCQKTQSTQRCNSKQGSQNKPWTTGAEQMRVCFFHQVHGYLTFPIIPLNFKLFVSFSSYN